MKADRPSPESPETGQDLGLDLAGARARMGGDETLLRGMVGYFLEDAPRLLDELERSLGKSEGPEVQRAAHSLKGLVANFGAPLVHQLAYRMETLARDGNLGEASNLFPQFAEQVRQISEALRPVAEDQQA